MTLTEIIKNLTEAIETKVYDNAKNIVKELRDAGYKHTYFVGGYVRDMLLDLDPKDIDIATEAKPEEVKEIFKNEKFIEVGESFNIVMLVKDGETFEIATFRGEGEYTDGRRPNEVFYADPERDALRRDFTINALFYDPFTHKIVDYVGGKKDIETKLLRAIGEPIERFKEDYLRMLRAIRFAAQKGFTIDTKTFGAIKQAAGNIGKISKERVKVEMDKILMSSKPGDYLEVLRESGLLHELYPEIEKLQDEDQNPVYHPEGNVFIHTKNALNVSDKDYILRWAILLHDIGKPSSRMVKKERIRHPGHEEASTKMADKILRKYKFDNKTREQIVWLIKNHGFGMAWKSMSEYKKKKLVSHPLFDKLLKHYEADRLSSQDEMITHDALDDIKSYTQFTDKFKSDKERWEQMKKFTVIDGNDLTKNSFQFKGKVVGEVLDDVKQQYITGNINSRQEALNYVKNKHWKKYIVKNLKIDGQDLISSGMKPGPEMGKTLQDIAQKVYDGELENDRDDLLDYIEKLRLNGGR